MARHPVVVIGAGLSGVSSAYHLAVKHGISNIVIVDCRPPLSFTSSMSLECYRDFWPQASMRGLLGRSIDLLENLAEETDNAFNMTRRGYVYLSKDSNRARSFLQGTTKDSLEGTRIHHPNRPLSYVPHPKEPVVFGKDKSISALRGVDLIESPEHLKTIFPSLSPDYKSMLHARRCGWLSAQPLGNTLLDKAKDAGVKFVSGLFKGITTSKDDNGNIVVDSVQVGLKSGQEVSIPCEFVLNAAGPYVNTVHRQISNAFAERLGPIKCGDGMPVVNELHPKIIFRDRLGVVPRDSPLLISLDETTLSFTEDEREALQEILSPKQLPKVLGRLPAGLHFRPYAHDALLLSWEFFHVDEVIADPPSELDLTQRLDPLYVEVTVRGMSQMVPGFASYIDNIPKGTAIVDAGFYCRTYENLPLIGPFRFSSVQDEESNNVYSTKPLYEAIDDASVNGVFYDAALSHYGVMSSMANGELSAKLLARALVRRNVKVKGDLALPMYTHAFLPERVKTKKYEQMKALGQTAEDIGKM